MTNEEVLQLQVELAAAREMEDYLRADIDTLLLQFKRSGELFRAEQEKKWTHWRAEKQALTELQAAHAELAYLRGEMERVNAALQEQIGVYRGSFHDVPDLLHWAANLVRELRQSPTVLPREELTDE